MRLAVWGHPGSEYPEGHDTIDDFRRGLENLRTVGIDLYMAFVLAHGKALFRSKTLGDPERDLLLPLMQCGRELGVEVHPIIGLGAVGIGGEGLYEPGATEAETPSWASGWPCAAWAENRQITVRVAQEIVESYQPHGLHMDYVRYPNTVFLDSHPCRCPRCRAERMAWLGREVPDEEDLQRPGVLYKEVEMRGRFISDLVRGLKDVASTAGIPLSMAARARYLKDAVAEGQDWARWAREGLVDVVCPMSYNPCDDRFRAFLDQHANLLKTTDAVWYAGIGRRSSLGEISAQQMCGQIAMADEAGADGVCIFHAGAFAEGDYEALRRMAMDD